VVLRTLILYWPLGVSGLIGEPPEAPLWFRNLAYLISLGFFAYGWHEDDFDLCIKVLGIFVFARVF